MTPTKRVGAGNFHCDDYQHVYDWIGRQVRAYTRNLSNIKRFYYFEWHGDGPGYEDTGLVRSPKEAGAGQRRQVYCTFKPKTQPGQPC
jgi:hypothetical protein